MWLVEAAGLRLVCDPLVGAEHHGGVFETVPRRAIDPAALRPDFLFVSHRHPDHFDVPSLHALARCDPQTVVVTPDPLVTWAARALGFATVHQLAAGQRVQLDGATVVTTPSLGPDEWGLLVAADGAVAWNQVDAVLRDDEHVRQVLATALPAVKARSVDLAIVRWQPMLEIAAVLGRATGFPHAMYADLLRQAAAVGAAAVVPGANGAQHVAAHRWLDRFVFPVSEPRFLADLARLSPATMGLPLSVGAAYEVGSGAVTLEPNAAGAMLDADEADERRHFRPLHIPPLCDPNPNGHAQSQTRPVVRRWLHEVLAPALAQAWPGFGADRPLRCVLEVVYESARDAYTLTVGPDGTRVTTESDPQWDVLDEVAGSLLFEVIEGRRHWGDVLLAGGLRAANRAYRVDAAGLSRCAVADTFLYYGLSYDASVERAVRSQVAAALA